MPKGKKIDARLPVRYLDDMIVLSDTHAWTYLRIPLVPYEFLSHEIREDLCARIALALSQLITSNQEAVDVHLKVSHRPFDTELWHENLRNKTSAWRPAPVWESYLDRMASRVNSLEFSMKEVHIGVCLGPRSGKNAPSGKSIFGELVAPITNLTKKVEKTTKFEDDIVPQAEIEEWHKRASSVHRTMTQSSLRAVPASAEEVAWLIAKPFWPGMEQPRFAPLGSKVWGLGELNRLAEGIVTNHHRYVEVQQPNEYGEVEDQKGYMVTLAVSRFPDVLYFPDQEPWMHFAESLLLEADFSTRMSIVPSMKVAKDIGKKLADAKDQAQHIAETGASVPLKVREQLQVATTLEYQIDKDRMPWAYARHRIILTAKTPEEVMAKAKTAIEKYRELGMELAWPSGDQMALMLEAVPGDKVRSTAYYQRQELTVVAGGMAVASSDVGDRADLTKSSQTGWLGPYLGWTNSRVLQPVFVSPHVAMAKNNPPGIAITGAPGGGKSFLAFTLAYQMAASGVWTIYLDPKADAKPMGSLPGLGKPQVFDLRDGNDGMLDPFSLGENRSEATLLALETLRLLLGGSVSEEREEALLNAVEVVSQAPNPSLSAVVDNLLGNSASPGARNLGAVLKTIRDLPFARLCFSATGGVQLRPEDGLTVVTLLGLDLPSASTNPDDYSYENRLAVSVMYLLTRYSRKLMLNMDKSHPKAICIDEAWAITSTPQGAKLIPEIARMGRSHNTALVLVSQNASDLMAESVTNSISTKFAFRSSIPAEVEAVLELFGLPKDQGFQSYVRNLKNGQCLIQDVDGRVSPVQIDGWDRFLMEAFDTNPETRGKPGSK